jgi:hypothetical protein
VTRRALISITLSEAIRRLLSTRKATKVATGDGSWPAPVASVSSAAAIAATVANSVVLIGVLALVASVFATIRGACRIRRLHAAKRLSCATLRPSFVSRAR